MKNFQTCSRGLWNSSIPNIKFDKNGVSNYYRMLAEMENEFPRGSKGQDNWKRILDKIKSKKIKDMTASLVLAVALIVRIFCI